MDRRRLTLQERLDQAFPTVVRYVGIALAVYVGIEGVERPSLAVLAAGMIAFKTVWGRNGKDGDSPA